MLTEHRTTTREARASKQNPCKICSRLDYCLHLDNGGMYCMREQMPGCEVRHSQKNGQTGYYYPPEYFDPSLSREARRTFPTKASQKHGNELAPIEVRDKTYRMMLECSPLSDEHRSNLLGRGIPQDKLTDYGTLWQDDNHREDICEAMKGLVEFKGVPGFYEPFLNVWTIAGPYGFTVPYFDRDKRIQGMQIRRAEDDDWGKYIWLSSNPEDTKYGKNHPKYDPNLKRYPNGTASGVFFNFMGPRKPVEVWVCEGALKSQVAHYLTGMPFMGLAGVFAGEAEAFLRYWDYWTAPATFVFCPDADFRDNKQVRNAWFNNVLAIGAIHSRIRIAVWDPAQGKGIDDYVKNTGNLPEVLSPRRWKERFKITPPGSEVA